MTNWYREYLAHKQEYLDLFDKCMQKDQEQNVEFLEESLKPLTDKKHIVACQSGTDALRFALEELGVGPGNEIMTTNFSWISTASCISMVGATPVFCDIDPKTYHLSMHSVRRMYQPEVKAIVYPHLFGYMSDMKELLDFCKEKNIYLIEDSAQTLGASLLGVKAGSIGDISTLSFNANKVIAGIAGGGAVCTNDKEQARLCKRLRKHGENKILGYNSKMLLMNAEFINFRLNRMKEWQKMRQDIAKQYDEQLRDYVTLQPTTTSLDHNYHKYVIRVQNKKVRDNLKKVLNAKVHYDLPLSENKMYKDIPYRADKMFISKIVCDTILTLPIHPYMTKQEVNKVINTIIITLEHKNIEFVNNIKTILGENLFDKSLLNETTEPIYDYIIEKIYQMPEYLEDVPMNKQKLKIAFNKFYENLTIHTN